MSCIIYINLLKKYNAKYVLNNTPPILTKNLKFIFENFIILKLVENDFYFEKPKILGLENFLSPFLI